MGASLTELSNRGGGKFDSRIRGFLAQAHAFALRTLPTRCELCGERCDTALLCPPCMNALPPLPAACPACALPTPGGRLCGACLAHPFKVTSTIAAHGYAFPLDKLVQQLKYGHRLAIAVPLGDALAAAALRAGPSGASAELLVPMPLSRARQRQRGFNQSAEIARVVSRRTGRALCHALARPLDRPPQAGLPWRERRRNVRGAFAATTGAAGRHVALVDDVMTTGATIEAAAAALLAAGAARVDAWVVARALPPGAA